jgi:transcriptional regulator with PAS, ATPase and Fis domain
MQKVFEVLPAISASPSTVLIYGETGTGKELMARTIHDLESKG